jgi:serine/threonine protein kinase
MTADVEPNKAPVPPPNPVIAGFQVLQVTDRDELGLRCRAREQSTGLVRTVRVITTPLTPDQRDALRRLWGTLLGRSFDPSLTTVVGYGLPSGGAPWVATDGDASRSLASQLATASLETPEVERIAVVASTALRFLHENGFVHAGMSPAVLVSDGEAWRVTDVGIAAITSPIREGLTPKVGDVTAHAAPEVLGGTPPTPAADVYALGATVAEALTGRPLVPWEPDEAVAVLLRRHAVGPPSFPGEAGSEGLWELIRTACQPEPERRPSADALQDLLGPPATEPTSGPTEPLRVTDDDVQFTVYRPRAVQPERWYSMIAFAHKTDPADPDFGPPDPLQEVTRQAKAVLGEDFTSYAKAAEDSASVVERGSELTFVPQMDGVEFNPRHSSFNWVEAVHREEFRLRASRSLDGQRARGRLSVFAGNLLVADVNLTLRVGTAPVDLPVGDLEPESARPYRKVFASYSHRDVALVQHIGMLVKSLGDEFVRDASHLRAGEVWSAQLEKLIRQADVFQLFWSNNSITSPFVRQEWEYALSLGRPFFVRPCYWEVPLPARPEEDLPPETLRRLHFQRLAFSSPSGPADSVVRASAPAPASVSASERVVPEVGGESAAAPSAPRPPATRIPEPRSVPPSPDSPPPGRSPANPRRRWAAALAGVGTAAALVLSLAVGFGGGSGSPTPPPAVEPTVPSRNLLDPASAPRPAGPVEPSSVVFDLPDGTLSGLSEVRGVDLEEQAQLCEQGVAGGCQRLFDELTDVCADGFGLGCDALWAVSPKGSPYRQYAATCGGRADDTAAGDCVGV